MMSAILKLKSDGAEGLLTAVLLLGCALNAALLMAYAGRVAKGSHDTVGVISQTVAAVPARTGRDGAPSTGTSFARSLLPRALRAS